MEYKGKRILLFDGYGRQVPTLLKQFHELGCKVTTINDSKLDIGYSSRYPANKMIIKGCREDALLLRPYLEKMLAAEEYDVLFPLLEKTTDLVLSLQEEGKLKKEKVIAAPRQAFMKAYDKQETMKVCMENGIPCPKSKLEDETLEQYLAKVQFPLACKPRKGSGAAGFKIVENKDQLFSLIDSNSIMPEEYVFQEYIPHTDSHYGVYLMFDQQGECSYSVVVQSCRQFPVDGGPGCFIRTINNEQIKRDSERLLKLLGWKGFGHVGLIMDPRDGVAKVMEINGRIPAGIKICNCVGIPSVKLLLDGVYGEPVEKYDGFPENIGLRHFQADLMWLLKSPNRFKAKPSWFNFSRSYDYVFSWKDPIPFLTYSIEHVLSYRRDMKKREHYNP